MNKQDKNTKTNAKTTEQNNNIKLAFNMDKKEVILENIDKLNKMLKTSQDALHVLACQSILHHYIHGDDSLIRRLIDGLPVAIRKSDLLRWVINFGAFKYDIKNGLQYDKEKRDNLLKDNKYIDVVNNAYATPFYKLNKDKDVIQKTFLDILKDLEKSLVYDLEKRKTPRYKLSDLTDIRGLISKRQKNA